MPEGGDSSSKLRKWLLEGEEGEEEEGVIKFATQRDSPLPLSSQLRAVEEKRLGDGAIFSLHFSRFPPF